MKVKIQGKWQEDTKSFSKTEFQIKETDKSIRGRFVKNRKDNEDKWIAGTMTFVVFKSKVNQSTINAIINHGGNFLEIKGDLMPEKGKDGKVYWCFIIEEASHAIQANKHTESKQNGYQPSQDDDDYIPF